METRTHIPLSVNKVRCGDIPKNVECMTLENGTLCTSGRGLPDGMMTMPYDNSLKGRRDKCYEISSRQNSYVPDNMYVISRNVRDVNKTLTDLSVIGMNTVKWNDDE